MDLPSGTNDEKKITSTQLEGKKKGLKIAHFNDGISSTSTATVGGTK